MKSDLVEKIRRKRRRQRTKQAFDPGLFTRIYTVCRMKGQAPGDRQPFDAADLEREISFEDGSLRGPLFALVTLEEYEEITAAASALEKARKAKGER